ncbi:GNAT family N-acetyltransferase [Candidatus Izemoplasma sp. B36]|uniref:GNAT family N-acetyltransferase n=1 Tax=Candidatus Izemoplasma sp. B36 TaxID=3242468 RepID=UPI0035579400
MGILKYQTIETERLVLRYPKRSDYSYQFKYLSKKDNFPYADYAITKKKDDVKIFFNRMLKDQEVTSLFWMICLKEGDIPIGTISAWNVDFDQNSIEFGYSLYPEHRGKGYMKETLSSIIDYCYFVCGFNIFDIWTHKKNTVSIRLARRLGFKFGGYVTEKAKNEAGNIIYATYRLEKY